MAAVPATVQACTPGVVPVCRSCHLLESSSKNAVCASSQVVLSGRLSIRNGSSETRICPPGSLSVNPRSTSTRLRAAASTEFEIVSGGVSGQDEAQPFLVPENIPLPDSKSPAGSVSGSESVGASGLPSEFEDAARLVKGSGDGDLPGAPSTVSPSADDLPSFPNVNDSPPPSTYPDMLPFAGDEGPPDTSFNEYLDSTEGNILGDDQFQSNVDEAVRTAKDAFAGPLERLEDGIKSIQDAAINSVDGVVNSARGIVDSTRNSLQNAVDSVNASVAGVFTSITGNYNKSLNDLQSNVSGAKTSAVENVKGFGSDFTSTFTSSGDTLREVIIVVKNSTGYALDEAGKLIVQGYAFTKNSAPQDVQSFLETAEEKVSQITGPVGSTIDQAVVIFADAAKAVGLDPNDPVFPALFIAGGSLAIGLAYFNSRYGGYSGDLQASEAYELLKNERNAILIDIRSQEAREIEGVPDFRRSFRSKLAAVEILKVEPASRGLLKNVNDVEALLTAAVVRNLKNVEGSSQVFVMDSNGGQAKQIARGLRKSGLKRAYIIEGGFKAWVSAGLRYKDGTKKPSALSILTEDAAEIVKENNITPLKVFAVLLGLASATYAALEWETTLQYIGILGVFATIFIRVEGYETIEDAKADLRSLLAPFSKVSQGATWVAGFVEPKKLQLATAPASSNVQGRVIQAAAKHGQTSPDLEAVDDSGANPIDESTQELGGQEAVDGGSENGSSGGDGGTKGQHTNLQES